MHRHRGGRGRAKSWDPASGTQKTIGGSPSSAAGAPSSRARCAEGAHEGFSILIICCCNNLTANTVASATHLHNLVVSGARNPNTASRILHGLQSPRQPGLGSDLKVQPGKDPLLSCAAVLTRPTRSQHRLRRLRVQCPRDLLAADTGLRLRCSPVTCSSEPMP